MWGGTHGHNGWGLYVHNSLISRNLATSAQHIYFLQGVICSSCLILALDTLSMLPSVIKMVQFMRNQIAKQSVVCLAEGHHTVAEGWAMFEQACDKAGPGDLPQLLRSLKRKIMPTPTPMPMSMDLGKATPEAPIPPPTSSIKQEPQVKSDEPVVVLIDGKRKWICPQCDKVMGSWNGCDAHIRATPYRKSPCLCPVQLFNIQPGFAAQTQKGT